MSSEFWLYAAGFMHSIILIFVHETSKAPASVLYQNSGIINTYPTNVLGIFNIYSKLKPKNSFKQVLVKVWRNLRWFWSDNFHIEFIQK